MSVRAKFTCTSKSTTGESSNIRLDAVSDAEGSNKDWAKYTPCGQLLITIDNPPAAEQFEVGKAYFLDFTPAE